MKTQPNWNERQQQVREDEWQLSREAFQAVRDQLTCLRKRPFDKIPINHLIKLIEVASTLGRRATGLPLEPVAQRDSFGTWQAQQDEAARQREVREAVQRVYSKPLDELRAEITTQPPPQPAAKPPLPLSAEAVTPGIRRGHLSSGASSDPNPSHIAPKPCVGGPADERGSADHRSEAPESKIENPKSEIPINPIDRPKKNRSHNGIYLGNTAYAALAINSITARTQRRS